MTLEMIKWEHSVFALPFALCGAMLAANGLPSWPQLAWIIVAMVSARSAAVLLYSYSKRFTRWSHLLLGLALGIAPAAAWIAVRGSLDPRVLLLTAAVTFWVAGFDVLYACQDCEFDQQAGLHSVPRYLGVRRALATARIFHLLMLLLLSGVVMTFALGNL